MAARGQGSFSLKVTLQCLWLFPTCRYILSHLQQITFENIVAKIKHVHHEKYFILLQGFPIYLIIIYLSIEIFQTYFSPRCFQNPLLEYCGMLMWEINKCSLPCFQSYFSLIKCWSIVVCHCGKVLNAVYLVFKAISVLSSDTKVFSWYWQPVRKWTFHKRTTPSFWAISSFVTMSAAEASEASILGKGLNAFAHA